MGIQETTPKGNYSCMKTSAWCFVLLAVYLLTISRANGTTGAQRSGERARKASIQRGFAGDEDSAAVANAIERRRRLAPGKQGHGCHYDNIKKQTVCASSIKEANKVMIGELKEERKRAWEESYPPAASTVAPLANGIVDSVRSSAGRKPEHHQIYAKLKPGDKCKPSPHLPVIETARFFLSAGLVVRNEAPFIEEWARHYLGEGVEHFYMIDQETVHTRGARRVLGSTAAALEAALPNVTTHVFNPPLASAQVSRNSVKWAKKTVGVGHMSVANMPNMYTSYVAISRAARKDSTWLLMVDSDEFTFASAPVETLATALAGMVQQFPHAGQVNRGLVDWNTDRGHFERLQARGSLVF